jgi:threonylcarbamoyladenosine tRNA methylthiotransferase CDKAL1
MVGPEDWSFFFELLGQSISENQKDEISANLFVNEQLEITHALPISRLYAFVLGFRRALDGRPKKLWYIRIESGCSNCCTYCSDVLAYKSFKSQSIESILHQFSLGLKKGYKYFALIGRDQGSYGLDKNLSLADLLKAIIKNFPNQDYQLLLDQVSPNTLINIYPELNSEILSTRIFELGSHIQSGSDRILRLMGKNFKARDWIKVVKDISVNYPNVRLHTSIIVGFPSESEHDFAKSINLLKEVLFDKIFVYSYSERPGLPSLKIGGCIPESTKRGRRRKMKLAAKLNTYKKRIIRNFPFNIRK